MRRRVDLQQFGGINDYSERPIGQERVLALEDGFAVERVPTVEVEWVGKVVVALDALVKGGEVVGFQMTRPQAFGAEVAQLDAVYVNGREGGVADNEMQAGVFLSFVPGTYAGELPQLRFGVNEFFEHVASQFEENLRPCEGGFREAVGCGHGVLRADGFLGIYSIARGGCYARTFGRLH